MDLCSCSPNRWRPGGRWRRRRRPTRGEGTRRSPWFIWEGKEKITGQVLTSVTGRLRSSNFSYLKQTLIKPGTNNPELYQMCLSLKWCSDSEVYFHFVISHQSAQQETKQLTVELPLRSSSCLQLHRHHPPSLLCTCSDCLSLSDSEPCPSLPVNIWTSAIDLISQQIKGCPVHRSIHIICCVEQSRPCQTELLRHN